MSLALEESRCRSRLSRGGGSSGFGMQQRRTEEAEMRDDDDGGVGALGISFVLT